MSTQSSYIAAWNYLEAFGYCTGHLARLLFRTSIDSLLGRLGKFTTVGRLLHRSSLLYHSFSFIAPHSFSRLHDYFSSMASSRYPRL
ncbi:uncharacterized protein LMH87_008959 [Akanthomyces muscarius]|uniref:Uncharacterized protein n=1 Tax=Akanthomyces muscarius TaxID=2231603 RepID=A0A9W8QJ16_AKAMU|nr:uncharacterized protein LMH87_008959 [Akanthomyces muscarius]KAJ4158433.1 hypothetical protein LMH87_008959 [Akanthomyces muscarius]